VCGPLKKIGLKGEFGDRRNLRQGLNANIRAPKGEIYPKALTPDRTDSKFLIAHGCSPSSPTNGSSDRSRWWGRERNTHGSTINPQRTEKFGQNGGISNQR
jgi:hypothetical protein